MRGIGGARSAAWRRFSRNRAAMIGGMIILVCTVAALSAPWFTPHDPEATDLSRRLLPPVWAEQGMWRHPLGCDHLGRDILARVIEGSRVSLFIGVVVVTGAAAIGTGLGLLAGFYRGVTDQIISGIVDILLAFPLLIFAIVIIGALGPGINQTILALLYKEWVPFCRLVRGNALALREIEYVTSARACGAGDVRLMLRHLLPNLLPSVVVLATLNMATVILMEASLSFLGLGVQPPTPAWGSMVSEGRAYLLTGWWVSTIPGLAIAVLALSTNMLGQGLRDMLDPHMRE